MEEVLKEYYKKMFNSEASDNADESQEEAFDGRSDDKGLEVESVAIAQFCGKSYAFIGRISSPDWTDRWRRWMPWLQTSPRRPMASPTLSP